MGDSNSTSTAFRAAVAAVALVATGCQPRPQPESARPDPAPLARAYAPSPEATCDDLTFQTFGGQWPQPQWVDLPDNTTLLGGGWSSISTGRFGSASWEHCENWLVVRPNGTHRALPSDHWLAPLTNVETNHCRVPDGVLGGRVFDFHFFTETWPGITAREAKERVGWAPTSTWGGDMYFFETLDFLSVIDGKWERGRFPAEGFHGHWDWVVSGDEAVVLAGGAEPLDGGANRPVGQTAVFDLSAWEWRYASHMNHARRGHELVAWDGAVLAFGGTTDADDEEIATVVERFEPRASKWTVASTDAPRFHRPQATVGHGLIAVAETSGGRESKFAVYDPETAAWSERTAPRGEVGRETTVLAHPTAGWLVVESERITRYGARDESVEQCEVFRSTEKPPEEKGDGTRTWGPAHLSATGDVLLTRIDRRRYHDHD